MSCRGLAVLIVTTTTFAAACQPKKLVAPTTHSALVNCSQVLSPQQQYARYRTAVLGLAKGLEPEIIPGLSCFLGDDVGRRLEPRQAYQKLVASTFNSDVLYGALVKEFEANLALDRQLGLKRDAGLAWPGAYLGEAALVAYRKTGQLRFVALFVDYFDAVLERRDDRLGRFDSQHQRVMKAWGSVTIGRTRWIAHVTHNARIIYPATQFARIVLGEPSLERFHAKAFQYLATAEETLREFDADLVQVPGRPGMRWYRRPADGNLEATNHVHVVGNAWLNLYALTRDPGYRERVEQLISVFEEGIHQEPGGLVSWNYFPVFATQERSDPTFQNGQDFSEPVWKASLTGPFLLRASQQGFEMPPQLIEALGRTFSTLTFQGDQLWRNVSRQRSRFVDVQKDRQKLGMLTNTSILVEFGSVSPDIPRKVAMLVSSRPDLFPKGWLSSPAALLSYAYYLSRN